MRDSSFVPWVSLPSRRATCTVLSSDGSHEETRPYLVIIGGNSGILEGIVESRQQREAAENAVHHMIGVRGMKILIGVNPSVKSTEMREKTRKALRGTAQMF